MTNPLSAVHERIERRHPMSDLREKVKGLPTLMREMFGRAPDLTVTDLIDRAAVLALIPEGAMLVTEEGLRTMLPELLHDLEATQHFATHETSYDGDDMEGVECITGERGHDDDAIDLAAAILDRLTP